MSDFETGRMTDANGMLVVFRAYPMLDEGRIVVDVPEEFPFALWSASHKQWRDKGKCAKGLGWPLEVPRG